MKTISTILAAAALILVPLAPATAAPSIQSLKHKLPACAHDEAAGPACYWDAKKRGNGQGQSFVWTGKEIIYDKRGR